MTQPKFRSVSTALNEVEQNIYLLSLVSSFAALVQERWKISSQIYAQNVFNLTAALFVFVAHLISIMSENFIDLRNNSGHWSSWVSDAPPSSLSEFPGVA